MRIRPQAHLCFTMLAVLLPASLTVHAQSTQPAAEPATSSLLQGQTRAEKSAQAPNAQPREKTTRELDAIVVLGYRLDRYQGEAAFDDTFIDALPRGNGDIGTLLRAHPNVQFDEAGNDTRTPGEIRPAEISINGGLFYQNAFQIDGVNFSNDIDPSTARAANSFDTVPSASQGLALDTSLVERLSVYDSNVPAAFGKFTGGVVDAVTRTAGDRLSGQIALRTTRDSWTRYQVEEAELPEFELSNTENAQPRFTKYDLRTRLEGRFDNGIGLLGRLNVVRSIIPLRVYDDGFESASDASERDQVRQNLNLLLKGDWTAPGGTAYTLSTLYAPTDERYFRPNARDSVFDVRQGGPVVAFNADTARGAYRLQAQMNYSNLSSSRRSEADFFRPWRWSTDKNWGDPSRGRNASSVEGAFGDIDQRQREIGLRLGVQRDPLRLGRTEHRFDFGLQVTDRYAFYERLGEHRVYRTPQETRSCVAADGRVDTESCSEAPTLGRNAGQYFQFLDLYSPGSFELDVRDIALYFQDDIAWSQVSLRPGVRVEQDDFAGRRTVSPRLAFGYDVFGNGDTRVSAGVNRYYGRTVFAAALREGREALRRTFRRGPDLIFGVPVQGLNQNRLQDLGVPYADERTLGLEQVVAGATLGVKWVRRDGRREIVRQRIETDEPGFVARPFVYANDGRSRSDTYTLNISPLRAFEWRGARHQGFFAADRTEVRRNYSDYDSFFDAVTGAEQVLFEGRRIRRDELPAENFNRPWSARLALRSDVPRFGLILSHFLRYRAGYRDIGLIGEEEVDGQTLEVYGETAFPDTWTLDSSLEWRGRGRIAPFVRLEANNVTDRRNESRTRAGGRVFEAGRQYWLELGVRF